MSDLLSVLKEKNVEELKALKQKIEELIQAKEGNEILVDFYCEGSRYRPAVYVAKLKYKNGLEREFINLGRTYTDKNNYIVEGTYKAREGEIIEEQIGGSNSGKTKYRDYYIVYKGELTKLKDNSLGYIIDYLKGDISAEELVDKVGIKKEDN